MFDNIKHRDVFHALINMFYAFDGVDKAINVWREMVNNKPTIMGFTFILNLCVKNGDYLKAFEIFDEMQNDHHVKPDAAVFRIMLKACGSERKMIDAMCQQIVNSGESIDKRTASTLMTAYNKCGDKKSAGMIWKRYQEAEKRI